MTPWFVHIGYEKCGSTWMQKRLFPRLTGVEFLGKRYDKAHWVREVWQAIANKHCFDFSPAEMHRTIERHAGPGGAFPRLLSAEILVGTIWSGAVDSRRNADRIKAAFPEAKILLVVRRQPELLESMYKQYLLWGGVLRLQEFLDAQTHHLNPNIDALLFHRIAEHYIRLYGRERIMVTPFELLAKNPQQYCDNICDFFGSGRVLLTENDREYVRRGFTPRQCDFVRRVNFLRKGPYNPAGFFNLKRKKSNDLQKAQSGLASRVLNPYFVAEKIADAFDLVLGSKKLMNDAQRRTIQSHFELSNRRLAELFPVLADHGYVTSSPPQSAAI